MNSRPQLVLTGAVMVAILTVVAAGCTGTAPTPVQGSTATTANVSSGNPDIHTIFVESNDGRVLVLRTIASAQKTITLTIYHLDDPEIVAALATAYPGGGQYPRYQRCPDGDERVLRPHFFGRGQI